MAKSVASEKFRALPLTLQKIAEALDVSVGTVSKWQNGLYVPKKPLREKIAREWPEVEADAWHVPVERRQVVEPPDAPPPAATLAEVGDHTIDAANQLLRVVRADLAEAEAEPELTSRAATTAKLAQTLTQLEKLAGGARELSAAQLVKMPAFRKLVDEIMGCLCDDCLTKVSEVTGGS